MRARRWGAGAIGLCWLMAASCSVDQRRLALRGPGIGQDAGLVDGGTNERERAPRLEVSPVGIDLGSVTTGFPARARLLVRNAGDAPLPVPVVTWTEGSASDFAIIQNRCERDIAPAESCEIRIQVVPAQAGALRGTLHVESVAGAFDVDVAALGLEAGELVLAPLAGSFEDYGGVLVGGAEEGTFTLSNPSAVATGALQIGVNRPEFAFLDPGPEDCVPGTTSLEPAASCNVRLAFTPAERGNVDATLTVASDGAGSVSLTLAGRGLVPGVLHTSTTALDFEGVLLGQSATRTATFANGGDEPLAVSGASLEPEDVEGFAIAESDCSPDVPLEGGKSCSVRVELRPPRAGEPLSARLVVAQVGGAALGIPATGVGLLPGALEAVPATEGEDAFGDVLVGETLERTLVIGNPGAQPSGVLELSISEGFEIVEPPGPGECVPGTTSLVDGQTCSVRVRFSPTGRDAVDGALTVTSSLLGAVALPISGRGVVAGQLEVAPEINFGRVLTAASAQRPLTVTNAGDQPLAPPTLEVTGDPAQRAAFELESACVEPVEPGQSCEVTLTFAPTVAVPHAADLKLVSGSSTAAVLLLGEALVPGSLVLAAAADSSAAFGDVAIGTTASRSFTLTNPGAIPSGKLTITTDNNQFAAALGDCNQGDPAGLVDGSSCTFSVAFTPANAQAAVANVSVQSPGAGRAGLEISGRGRTKATLVAAAVNKDMGRAIVGQDALTVPENEFTWRLDNTGDLATGALVLSNDNVAEFAVGADTCSGVELAGQGSCQVAIRFRPGGADVRTGHITVRDPVGMGSAVVTLTGTGVQLAPPGGECTQTSECAAGECAKGQCCDTACERPCEECVQGVCTEKSAGAICSVSTGAICFDVDSCKLPVGQACGSAAECGDGACEARLDGAGAADRVCCREVCSDGEACNADGACVQPRLTAGAACSGPGDPACGDGLDCKECRGATQRQCTPVADCCNGCDEGFECVEGSCQCEPGPDGVRGTPCAGVCISGDNACCPDVLACATPGLPFCDPQDNLCKQCGGDEQCGGTTPFCDLSAHVCRECLGNEQCGGTTPFCHPTELVCGGCVTDAECANSTTPICDTVARACKECLSALDCTENFTGTIPECSPDGVCSYPCDPLFASTRCGDICIPVEQCCDGVCPEGQVCVDGTTCELACPADAPPRCDGEQPQACVDGQFVNVGEACAPETPCVDGVCTEPVPVPGDACVFPDGPCGDGTCAVNGICCASPCGICQGCSADGSTCDDLATSPECDLVTCPPQEPQCTSAPLIDLPEAPPGEGQCAGPNTCATQLEICRQPLTEPTGCLVGDVPGQCQVDPLGVTSCILP